MILIHSRNGVYIIAAIHRHMGFNFLPTSGLRKDQGPGNSNAALARKQSSLAFSRPKRTVSTRSWFRDFYVYLLHFPTTIPFPTTHVLFARTSVQGKRVFDVPKGRFLNTIPRPCLSLGDMSAPSITWILLSSSKITIQMSLYSTNPGSGNSVWRKHPELRTFNPPKRDEFRWSGRTKKYISYPLGTTLSSIPFRQTEECGYSVLSRLLLSTTTARKRQLGG